MMEKILNIDIVMKEKESLLEYFDKLERKGIINKYEVILEETK